MSADFLKFNLDFCCGCGICAAICSMDCITISFDKYGDYKPIINDKTCLNCDLCKNVCPTNTETTAKIVQSFKNKNSDKSFFDSLGFIEDCYVGYTTIFHDRKASASGGLLTAVLADLLSKKIVDCIVLVGPSSYKLTRKFFEATFVDAIEDLDSKRGTKYYPIDYSLALKKVESEKDKRYAIVALPCAVLAIRKAQLNGRLSNVEFVFSLFCGHGVSATYTEFILKSNKIPLDSVKRIDYRNKTGISNAINYNLQIEWLTSKGSNELKLGFISSKIERIWSNFFFTPVHCLYCSDLSGKYADASFSDAWLPEYISDEKGTSIVVTRNVHIKSLINEMAATGKIYINSINPQKVIQANLTALNFKENSAGRIRISKLIYPNFYCNNSCESFNSSLFAAMRKNLFIILNSHFSRWLYRKNLIRIINSIINYL